MPLAEAGPTLASRWSFAWGPRDGATATGPWTRAKDFHLSPRAGTATGRPAVALFCFCAWYWERFRVENIAGEG